MWKHKRKHRSSLHPPVGLRMTSLMDILTCLLLFLLKSYGSDESMTQSAGLELPGSNSQDPVAASLVVAVSKQAVLVGDQEVARTDAIAQSSERIVPELDAKLRALQDAALAKAQADGTLPARTVVTLQGDRDLEFRVVEKVMATLEQAGYASISLAVVEDS
ncbi:MAG: biopolymer transporter ExbD [Candidatus Eisenbacteria bacterium]